LSEPIYLEPDPYDLPLPLIRVSPNLLASPTTPPESTPQQRLISQALTQVLTPLGVRFEFAIQHRPQRQEFASDREYTILQSPDLCLETLEYRLLVRCRSPKSLDCQLLAEPLARAIRSLDLQGFQAASIQFFQFSGREFKPASTQVADWQLKIDLTPPIVKLKSWARWGDVQSITKLLNLALAPEHIQVSAVLKNLTLQIFCTLKQPQSSKFPTKKIVLDTIAPLLISLTPQGIQGATIHGLQSQAQGGQPEDSPVWMHWLDLPGLGDPKFSPTPIILASRGDRAALNFILERLLNPDLDQCFASGGIKLSLLDRHHLLHVMSEGTICPIQSQVAMTVVKVLKQLRLPGIVGVRVHGRVSGQSVSLWTYGIDFDRSPLQLPPVASAHQFVVEPAVTQIGLGQRISEYLLGTGIWKPQFTLVKTSQLVCQPRFQWQPSLLLLLVGLGLAIGSDLTIKAGLAARNLTARSTETTSQLSFNNPLLEQKLAQYQLRCLQHGVPDILIVGSSRALRGIDPQVLQQNLVAGNSRPKIYNFGINGATAQVVDLILRQLLTPQQLPKLVIWADGARAFNSGRIDRTYETIVLSDRYRQLAAMSGFTNSNSSLLQAQSSFRNTYQAIDTAFDRRLAQVSPAYHHRDQLKTWLRSQVPVVPQITDGNNSLLPVDSTASIADREPDFDGFLSLELQFDPTTYHQKYPKVTGDSDGDYTNFQLVGNQERALSQTIDFLANRKISLVFVNMPLSDVYLDKFRRQHETIFQQYMQNLTSLHQLTFVDMNGLLDRQYDRFSDPSHLNQFGANAVSRYLATVKDIPWQTLTPDLIVDK
jgi:hypothetical protein